MIAVEGGFVDLRDDLDATAVPKPPPVKKTTPRKPRARKGNGADVEEQSELLSADLPLDVYAALCALGDTAEGIHTNLVALCGRFAAEGMSRRIAAAVLQVAFDSRPADQRDERWIARRAEIGRTLDWAYEREAATGVVGSPPLSLPPPGSGTGSTPPPPPPPLGAGSVPGTPPPQPGPTGGSGKRLMRNKNPKYAGNLANVITALVEDPELIGCVAYDLMARSISLRRALPGDDKFTAPRLWDDADTGKLQDYLQTTVNMARVGKETVQQGADLVARNVLFHPVRDYLDGLAWDGTPRVDTWLTTYLGVPASDYVAKTGRWWLIGMVARIFRPGCKFDYMLILEGLQGTLKSQVCVALCGPWVSDQSLDIRHDRRGASQLLRNCWLVEIAELASFRQNDVEILKAFVTRPTERYIPRYGYNGVEEPRMCGFLGTTNQETYLHDATGGRRFWPHRTSAINCTQADARPRPALGRGRRPLPSQRALVARSGL